MRNRRHKLIILSGPSCAGKSPLAKALQKFFPQLMTETRPLVLYNSRKPRPEEKDGIDYFFRSLLFIKNLKKKDYYRIFNVRGDLQALGFLELKNQLEKTNVFFEGNPFVGKVLLSDPFLKSIPKISAFLSPLSKVEIQKAQKDLGPKEFSRQLTLLMRNKLRRRTLKQKKTIGQAAQKDIARRARSAFKELKEAYLFKAVIVNHDGEDSDHWDIMDFPIGEARRSLLSFTDLLQRKKNADIERWSPQLI